jgi:hypothetical protein
MNDANGLPRHTSVKYPTLIYEDYDLYSSFFKGTMAIPLNMRIDKGDLVLHPNSITVS